MFNCGSVSPKEMRKGREEGKGGNGGKRGRREGKARGKGSWLKKKLIPIFSLTPKIEI
jgi:hypothetical protein